MSREASCIFCKIAQGEVPANKAGESDSCFAFHDINPMAPKHILIIPKTHVSSVADLNASSVVIISDMMLLANKVVKENEILASGFRLVINNGKNAGQTVDHLHLHILGGREMVWPPG